MNTELEKLLYTELGELMYKKENCFDWIESKELQGKIEAVYTLLEIDFTHEPSILEQVVHFARSVKPLGGTEMDLLNKTFSRLRSDKRPKL